MKWKPATKQYIMYFELKGENVSWYAVEQL